MEIVLPVDVRERVDATFHTVPVPPNVHVPVPMVIARVKVPADETSPAVTLKLLALSVPLVSVNVDELTNASCRVRVPPNMNMVTRFAKLFPALVSVNDPRPRNSKA